jgi:hypothetical protein
MQSARHLQCIENTMSSLRITPQLQQNDERSANWTRLIAGSMGADVCLRVWVWETL